MKSVLIPVLGSILFISACKNESKTEKSTTTDTTAKSATTPGVNTNVVTNPTPVVTTNSANSNSGIGMNPEHGKPGHRCDIPVGAPLNTPPPNNTVTNSTNVTAPTVTTPVVQPTTAPVNAASGMNPAHGQPGHRCDIPVGSPLNSKPVTTTTSPVKTN